MNALPNINVVLDAQNSIATQQINQIPHLSPETLKVVSSAIANQGSNLSKPESINLVAKKVETLKSVSERLGQAKENSRRDKIVSVLITALGLALLAATIICVCVLANPVAAVFVGFACFFFQYFQNCIYLDSQNEGQNIGCFLLAMTPLSYFVPIWTTFRKINRIENELKNESNALSEQLKKTLPAQIQYYEKNGDELIKILEEYLKLADQAYTNAKNDPLQLEECISRTGKEHRDTTTALKEIRSAAEFYKTLALP